MLFCRVLGKSSSENAKIFACGAHKVLYQENSVTSKTVDPLRAERSEAHVGNTHFFEGFGLLAPNTHCQLWFVSNNQIGLFSLEKVAHSTSKTFYFSKNQFFRLFLVFLGRLKISTFLVIPPSTPVLQSIISRNLYIKKSENQFSHKFLNAQLDINLEGMSVTKFQPTWVPVFHLRMDTDLAKSVSQRPFRGTK